MEKKKKKKIKKAKVTYKKNHQVDQYTDYESQKREAKGQTIYLKKCGWKSPYLKKEMDIQIQKFQWF